MKQRTWGKDCEPTTQEKELKEKLLELQNVGFKRKVLQKKGRQWLQRREIWQGALPQL